MKKTRFYAILAVAAFVTACEIGEPDDTALRLLPENLVEIEEPELQTFVFTSEPEGEDTKTVHSGKTILWSAGDQIRMGYTVDGTWQGAQGNATQSSPARLYASSALQEGEDGPTASFSVPGNFPNTGNGEYHFYTVYPASAVAENFSSAPSAIVTILTEQTPAKASFDPKADLMIGHSVRNYNSKPTEAIPLMWERKVAHGEITLKNLDELNGFSSSEVIQSVTLTAQEGAALTGDFSLNLLTGSMTTSNVSNSVTIKGDNLLFSGGNLTFWISIFSSENTPLTSLDVTLETDKAVYRRTISGLNLNFPVNAHRTLGIKMKPESPYNATRTAKQKVYEKVTASQSDWSGQYVLGYDDETVQKMLTGISTTSTKYGIATDVTITDDTIAYEDGHPYELTIAKSGNYYTMTLGEKYLGWTSGNSLTSTDSITSDTLNEYKWLISYSNGVLTIKSARSNVTRYLKYNTSAPRFACYESGQSAPSLYKLGEVAVSPDPQPEATATVTTAAAGYIAQTTATLNGSYTGATGEISEVGFYWGTSSTPSNKVTSEDTATPFTYSLSGLYAGTTYYVQAYVKEYNASTSSVEERKGAVLNFTTDAEPQTGGDYELVTASQTDWSGAYVLANTDANMMLTGVTTIGTVSSVTISNNKISYSAGSPYEITIAKSGTYYTLFLNGVGYLGWTSGNSLAYAASADSNNYKWSISYSSGALTIANAGDSTRKLQYNSSNPRFACYTSSQKAPQLFKRAGSSTPQITVTTEAVSNIANTSATLNGSYVVPTGLTVTERGFYFGSGSNPSTKITVSGTGTSFSYSKTGLTKGTAYSYKAYAIESDGTTTTTRYGEVVYFTTTGGTAVASGWLELPARTGSEDYYGTFYGSGSTVGTNRNYTYNYNYTYYASMWVAWPLTSSHTSGSGSTSKWYYNPNIQENKQVNITTYAYEKMYNAGTYARGHQCPNADRKSDDTMNKQTYYSTNQTPQIQNGFNGGIWSSLENATRNLLSSTDTVYVVTGPTYRKVGGSETITYLTGASGQNANPSSLPVPNYYWKALLKVKRSGTTITSASAIGFWFEHKVYSNSSYTNYAVSVDQIEAWTGFDLFANLPDGIEATAETNTNWTTFQNF